MNPIPRRESEDKNKRFCVCCNRDVTNYKSYRNRPHEQWICGNCHALVIDYENTLRRNRINQRKPSYKELRQQRVGTYIDGKWYNVKSSVPRTGVCNLCRNIAKIDVPRTEFHHDEYDLSDMSKHIIELCSKCHKKVGEFYLQYRRDKLGRYCSK